MKRGLNRSERIADLIKSEVDSKKNENKFQDIIDRICNDKATKSDIEMSKLRC